MSSQVVVNSPYFLAPGAGKPLNWLGATVTIKASSPEVGVTDVVIKPGQEPPLHIHKNEDEWFYMLEGEVTFHVGKDSHRGQTGAFVSFPRGIPHTFTVETESAHFLVLNTPGGFERMFELSPKTPEEAERALKAYGMEVVGPHPRHAAAV